MVSVICVAAAENFAVNLCASCKRVLLGFENKRTAALSDYKTVTGNIKRSACGSGESFLRESAFAFASE